MLTTITATTTVEPELKYTNAGKPFLRIPCAVNYNTLKDGMWEKSHTDYLTITSFKNAETLAELITKGTRILATVDIRTQKNQDGTIYLNTIAREIGVIPKNRTNVMTDTPSAPPQSTSQDETWDTEYGLEPPF